MSAIKESLQQLIGVKIEINGTEYRNRYADDLAIDCTNLDDEFAEQAQKYTYYATLAELAEDRMACLNEELDKLKAYLDHEIRTKAEQFKTINEKFKITETMISNEIILSQQYQVKLKEVQEARHLYKTLKCAPFAFSQRKDMLCELGVAHNATLKDPRVQQERLQQARTLMENTRRTQDIEIKHIATPQRRRTPINHD